MPEFKVVSQPDGKPIFIDAETGAERPFMRQTLLIAEDAKAAKAYVTNQNYDSHVQTDEPLYEVVSVKELNSDEE